MSTVGQTPILDPGSSQAVQQAPSAAIDNGAVCIPIPNISTQERRKRLTMGVVMFVISLVTLGLMMTSGISRWWRLPLFLLFFAATSGFFQWRDKTCVGLAARDSRKLGDAYEKIGDAAELAQVRRQARRLQIEAFVVAVPLAVIALLLPVL